MERTREIGQKESGMGNSFLGGARDLIKKFLRGAELDNSGEEPDNLNLRNVLIKRDHLRLITKQEKGPAGPKNAKKKMKLQCQNV